MNDNFIRKISIDWSDVKRGYLHNIKSLKNMSDVNLEKSITFFVGENGSGKSTLLEAIAVCCGFNPEGGTKNYNFSTQDTHSDLYEAIVLTKGVRRIKRGYFLRAETFYNVATKDEEYSRYLSESTKNEFHKKSHGESFLTVSSNYFGNDGLYILDEIDTALSIQNQLTLLKQIYDSSKNGSQFIIVTHSPVLLAMPDADIYEFSDIGIDKIDYENCDSYLLTKMFIENREHMLKNMGMI